MFSTSENNQTQVEIHILQGEREMAANNKSLGKFILKGLPPAPRGVPQVRVAFDIDANGILQVTALDMTTGREQSVIIQDASTLNEAEVRQAIEEAQQFADQDRSQRDRVDKRNRAEALTFQAERQLREATLDFGMQFVEVHRRAIEKTVKALREAIAASDDIEIDRTQADLQDAIYNLNRDVRDRYAEEDDDNFFGSIRRTFQDGRDAVLGGGDRYDRDYNYGRNDYGRNDYGRNDYGRGSDLGRGGDPGRGDRGWNEPNGQGDRRREPSRPASRDPYDLGYGGGYGNPADRPSRPTPRDGSGRSGDRREARNNNMGGSNQPRDRRSTYNDNWDDEDDWF